MNMYMYVYMYVGPWCCVQVNGSRPETLFCLFLAGSIVHQHRIILIIRSQEETNFLKYTDTS